MAGVSIPGSADNVAKPALKGMFHLWNGDPVGRGAAMPHIKTYTRCALAAAMLWRHRCLGTAALMLEATHPLTYSDRVLVHLLCMPAAAGQ